MDSFLIGICGGSCSGKTTLAAALKKSLGDSAVLIKYDNYYLPRDGISPEDRKKINYDHPSAFETGLFVKHLKALKDGGSIDSPLYDFSVHDRKKERLGIDPGEFIIAEGILLFADESLRELFDLKIFVDASEEVRLNRRIMRDTCLRGRDARGVREQFFKTVRPMHEQYVEPFKKFADIVVCGDNLKKDTDSILKDVKNKILNLKKVDIFKPE